MAKSNLNLLIVNDSPNEAEEIISLLRRAGIVADVVRPNDLENMQSLLKTRFWHLAWMDNDHPKIDIADASKALKSTQTPWHYLCEELNTDAITHGIELGAFDTVCPQQSDHFLHALDRDTTASQLKRRYDQLNAQAEEFDQRQVQILDASSDAMAYIIDGIILSCNDSFAEHLGVTKQDLTDLPLFDYIEQSSRDALKIMLKKASEGDVEHVSVKLSNGKLIQARLVTTYYDGEEAIQLSFKDEQTAAIAETPAKPIATEDLLLDSLGQFTSSCEGVLVVIEIDKTAQLRAKYGFVDGRKILNIALEFIDQAIATNKTWSASITDNCLAVYMKEQSLASVRDFLPTLLKQIEQKMFEHDQKTVQLTCSVGVASLTEDITAEQWLNNAYQAMFEARAENDGNAFKLYTTDIRSGVAGNTGMTLDDALSLERFRMSFQPLVSIKEHKDEYFESYLRMLDQNDEEISPSLFIDAFTQREFNTKLDRWVILECFKKLNEALKFNPETKLIINLTANALNDDKLLPWIGIAMRTAEISPDRIVFQFIEEHVESYLLRAIKVFKQLESYGCQISVNRVGEHSNSMKLFDKVKPRFAKLAMRFMQALQHDSNPELLKQALAVLKEKNVESIVGFVESANTMATLWQMDVSLIQGYYMGAPSPDIGQASDF